MPIMNSWRARTALIGLATALVALGGQALPAAAESDKHGDVETYQFVLSTDNDVTNFLPACPAASPYHFMCGTGTDEPLQATNTGDDAALQGTITESYFNALDFPAPTPTCPAIPKVAPGALKDFSSVTLTTVRGDIFLVTHDGSFCTSTNSDVEPFNIVGGTGKYQGARGFGVVNAHATKAQTTTQGFASEVFSGTITVGR